MFLRIGFCILLLATSIPSANAEEVKSFIDEDNIELFIYENFDLMTIRSSFGPRRISGQSNSLRDYGLPKPEITKSGFYIATDDWQYSFHIIGIKDYNDDGLIDVFVCFIDDALKAYYYSQNTILMTRYSKDMPLIALDYQPHYDGCNEKQNPPSLKEVEEALEEWRQRTK